MRDPYPYMDGPAIEEVPDPVRYGLHPNYRAVLADFDEFDNDAEPVGIWLRIVMLLNWTLRTLTAEEVRAHAINGIRPTMYPSRETSEPDPRWARRARAHEHFTYIAANTYEILTEMERTGLVYAVR